MQYSYPFADSLALSSNGPQATYGFNFSSGVSTASGFPHGHGAISSPITPSITNSSTPPTPSIPATPATPATPLTPSVSPTPATPITASLEAGLHVCKWIGNHGLCDQVFADANSLHEHCRQKHTNDLKKRRDENGVAGYKCFWAGCNRGGEFPQKSKLERHLQTHTGYKPYKCPVCNLALSAKQSLAQHIRTHTGETPFKCEYEGCGQAFKQQSALTMHERTHTGVKPLECKICGKHFSESTNLTKHRRTHDNRRHECQTCGHKFCRLDQLRRHERTKHATP
ncbi:zinc-responsiveness transcriptional activator [Colletotrichum musicola]|uniref:Zinc-responsiveness transcriptional activator n=1 Tax=Colletotrichum musicola TaxID=2175873 RepID=A0A8H6NYE4_9PEZI|nr:zinc-responsiveness transcriptional activator [Colletotrichum musicola]